MGDGLDLGGLYLEVKHRAKHAAYRLHRDVRDQARKEKRLPVTMLSENGFPGLLICIDTRDWDEVVKLITENRKELVDPPTT